MKNDPAPQTTTSDALIQQTRAVPLERVLRELGRDPAEAPALLSALDKLGLAILYHSDIQQMGLIGDICTWDRTGQVCPYCQCSRRQA